MKDKLWSDEELKKSIITYFKMLNHEKNKTPYVKTEFNRDLQGQLPGRNNKSIEYRWQNISAVLAEHKIDFILGFKPAVNVGANVRERIWKIINDLKLLKK